MITTASILQITAETKEIHIFATPLFSVYEKLFYFVFENNADDISYMKRNKINKILNFLIEFSRVDDIR